MKDDVNFLKKRSDLRTVNSQVVHGVGWRERWRWRARVCMCVTFVPCGLWRVRHSMVVEMELEQYCYAVLQGAAI